jgi:hypothetical protein
MGNCWPIGDNGDAAVAASFPEASEHDSRHQRLLEKRKNIFLDIGLPPSSIMPPKAVAIQLLGSNLDGTIHSSGVRLYLALEVIAPIGYPTMTFFDQINGLEATLAGKSDGLASAPLKFCAQMVKVQHETHSGMIALGNLPDAATLVGGSMEIDLEFLNNSVVTVHLDVTSHEESIQLGEIPEPLSEVEHVLVPKVQMSQSFLGAVANGVKLREVQMEE